MVGWMVYLFVCVCACLCVCSPARANSNVPVGWSKRYRRIIPPTLPFSAARYSKTNTKKRKNTQRAGQEDDLGKKSVLIHINTFTVQNMHSPVCIYVQICRWTQPLLFSSLIHPTTIASQIRNNLHVTDRTRQDTAWSEHYTHTHSIVIRGHDTASAIDQARFEILYLGLWA